MAALTPEDKTLQGEPVVAATRPDPAPKVLGDRRPPEGEGYDLQRVYTEAAKSFWFRWDDRWWEMPHPRMLDFAASLRVESFDISDLISDDVPTEDVEKVAKAKLDEMFSLVMDAEQAAEWRAVQVRPLPMILDMFRQWTSYFKADPGESGASADSSKSTGRPSKRTSTGSTGSASRKPSRARKAAAGPPVSS